MLALLCVRIPETNKVKPKHTEASTPPAKTAYLAHTGNPVQISPNQSQQPSIHIKTHGLTIGIDQRHRYDNTKREARATRYGQEAARSTSHNMKTIASIQMGYGSTSKPICSVVAASHEGVGLAPGPKKYVWERTQPDPAARTAETPTMIDTLAASNRAKSPLLMFSAVSACCIGSKRNRSIRALIWLFSAPNLTAGVPSGPALALLPGHYRLTPRREATRAVGSPSRSRIASRYERKGRPLARDTARLRPTNHVAKGPLLPTRRHSDI